METRKLIFQYLVVIQVYKGLLFAFSDEDADAALIPDKVCLPFDKAALDRHLEKLDAPEVPISDTASTLLLKDIELLPFGALPVDWKRLRLLHDILPSLRDDELRSKLGVEKISAQPANTGSTGVSENNGAPGGIDGIKRAGGCKEEKDDEGSFLTTGNIGVPDENRETTTRVRFHRSTLYNENGNIDSSPMTVEPDVERVVGEEVSSSETDPDLLFGSSTSDDAEKNLDSKGIPQLAEVEKSSADEVGAELPNENSNFSTTLLAPVSDAGTEIRTVFRNTDTGIDGELVTTEEIKPDVTGDDLEGLITTISEKFRLSSPLPIDEGEKSGTESGKEADPNSQETFGAFSSTPSSTTGEEIEEVDSSIASMGTPDSTSTENPDFETTRRTVMLRIGELFSSVPKLVENHGDREARRNHVSRVRNFMQKERDESADRFRDDNTIDIDDRAFAKTELSVLGPFPMRTKIGNRRPKSRYGDNGLTKRGGHNTDTEKLYRWFYRKDQSPENSVPGGKAEAEIECKKRG